jgi:hypothetical protein
MNATSNFASDTGFVYSATDPATTAAVNTQLHWVADARI